NAVSSVGGVSGIVPIRPNGQPAPSAPAAEPAPQPARPPSDAEFLAKLAGHEAGGQRQTFARFQIDDKTHEVSVQIVDAGSQEVIRTIPNEDLRQLAHKYRATSGYVLDWAG